MACYKKRQLKFRRNGSTYALNLFDYADLHTGLQYFGGDYYSGYDLAVRVDDMTKYVPLSTSSSGGNGLAVRRNGTTLYPFYTAPTIKIYYSDESSTSCYNNVVTTNFNRRVTGVALSAALNVAVDIYMSANSGASWVKVGTLPKGSYYAGMDYTMTYVKSQTGSAPSYTNGGLRFKVRTAISEQSNHAIITWNCGTVSGVTNEVYAKVTLGHPLTAGYIEHEGEWNGFLPPFSTSGASTILSAGQSSGSATRVFVIAGALTNYSKINYVFEDSKTTIASYSFVPAVIPFSTITGDVYFNEIKSNPTDIFQLYGSWGGGAVQDAIPSTYW